MDDRKYYQLDGKAYPEVFTTIPDNQPKERKPGQFTEQQLKQFFEEGFLQVDDVFTRDELDPVRDATAELVDELANKLYKAGKIKNLYKEAGLFQRLSLIEEEFPGANIVLHKTGTLPQAYRKLWTNDRLLNLVEQLLGTQDIKGSANWNLRCKTPNNTASTVPWHQDSGFMDSEAHAAILATAWIPMLDSNKQNGCMQMVRGGHRKGLIANHTGCWKDTWYIIMDEEDMQKTLDVDLKKDVVTCQVPYGGALFFSNVIPHRSLNNASNEVRWSLDLRWQAMGTPDGMYGLKEGLRFRSSTDPNYTIDWEPWVAVDRTKLQVASCGESTDDLLPIASGPWMRKWPITHHNQHTAALEKQTSGKTVMA